MLAATVRGSRRRPMVAIGGGKGEWTGGAADSLPPRLGGRAAGLALALAPEAQLEGPHALIVHALDERRRLPSRRRMAQAVERCVMQLLQVHHAWCNGLRHGAEPITIKLDGQMLRVVI